MTDELDEAMTTKAFQLRGMIAGDIRLSMLNDPAMAGKPAKEWRAEFEARVKAETKGLPGEPHGYLRKVRKRIRAEYLSEHPRLQLTGRGGSLRQRSRFVSKMVRWRIRNG